MTLYLHIGMSKAGSSAIQYALSKNRDALQRRGVIYPIAGRVLPNGRTMDRHFLISRELRDGGHLKFLQKAIMECRGYDKAIISSEGFWRLPEAKVDVLSKHLSGMDITVILYLRRPSSYLKSSYCQKIKKEGKSYDTLTYLSEIDDKINYPRLLSIWGNRFLLNVRSYEANKHNLEQDFFKLIGEDLEQERISRSMVNKTPSDKTMATLRLINAVMPTRVARKMRRYVIKTDLEFPFVRGIDYSPLVEYGDAAKRGWATSILREYMSGDDLDCLLEGLPGRSGRVAEQQT